MTRSTLVVLKCQQREGRGASTSPTKYTLTMLLAATVALALASSAAAQSAEPLKIYAPSADFWCE